MKGLIVVNAYTKGESELYQSKRMKEEFSILGVNVDIVRNNTFLSYIDGEEIELDNFDYDFCIYYDKDKYMSKMLEEKGVRLFNRHDAIRVCDDKMMTYIALSNSNIKMPLTLAGLLCYYPNEPISKETVERIEQKIGYPVIVKICYGSLGKGVYKAESRDELVSIMKEVKTQPHLFQKFIATSKGKDIRTIVIGKKIIASMVRHNDNDFRSNIELGGFGEKFDLPDEYKDICLKVVEKLNLDYAGVDILFGENNEPIICEVNSNAFFGGIEKVSGINIAKEYADYIYNEIIKGNH